MKLRPVVIGLCGVIVAGLLLVVGVRLYFDHNSPRLPQGTRHINGTFVSREGCQDCMVVDTGERVFTIRQTDKTHYDNRHSFVIGSKVDVYILPQANSDGSYNALEIDHGKETR